MPRWSESPQRSLMMSFPLRRPSLTKPGLGFTGETSLAVNISKEVKFVKAKELMVAASTVEKENVEKKMNVADQRVVNKPRNQSMVRFVARAKSLP